MEVLWLTEALLVAGQIEWWLPKQEKQSSVLCLTEAVLSQLLVLKFCSMLIPSFVMIDGWQPDNWHSIFQSAKVVLVTPFEILDIWRCEWDGVFRASQLKTSLFILSYWHVLNLDCYNRWSLDPSFWTGVREAIHGMAPSSFSQEKKLKKSPSPGEVMITDFWHFEDVILVNAMLKWETVNSNAYIRTLTELRNHFKWIQPHQNPTESSLHHDIARLHMFVDLGSHHRIWFDCITQPTLQPQCSILRFMLIRRSEWWNLQCDVWDWWWDSYDENLAMWAGQGMILTRHIHTCSSLVQGCRIEQRLVET